MRFLLDAHFSQYVARAMESADFPVVSVKDVDVLGTMAPDRDIARWCGEHGHVWVTVDRDARSREMRLAILPVYGAKVILLKRDPKSAREQMTWLVKKFDQWEEEVRRESGYVAWLQGPSGRLKKLSK